MEATLELSRQNAVERQEQERHDKAAFLGGIFAAGGRIAFNIENQTKNKGGIERVYNYAYPLISFTDANKRKLDKLKELFGGKTMRAKTGANSITWYLKSEEAVDLAKAMREFCPNRAEIITAFENWENADVEERLQMARDFKNVNSSKVEDYLELVRNPQFLAGVLTARGGITQRLKGDILKDPELTFSSTNLQLVQAIKKEYGAGIHLAATNSNQTSLGRETSARVLSMVKDHLLVPLENLPVAA